MLWIQKYRYVILPLVGALGALIAVLWPAGHGAFCAGIAGAFQ